jgi:hypothetical protein
MKQILQQVRPVAAAFGGSDPPIRHARVGANLVFALSYSVGPTLQSATRPRAVAVLSRPSGRAHPFLTRV